MPYEVRPYLSDRVILTRYWGAVTAEEIQAASAITLRDYMQPYTHKVHQLIDISGIVSYPTNIPLIAQSMGHLRAPQMGHFLLFSTPDQRVASLIGSFVAQLNRTPFWAVASYAEAHRMLAGILPDLVDQLPPLP
jgi:hypothetical protein